MFVILAGVEKALRRKREFKSVLPPFKERETVIVEHSDIAPGLWTLTQPWPPLPFNNTSADVRMTVYRLEDGSLWVSLFPGTG